MSTGQAASTKMLALNVSVPPGAERRFIDEAEAGVQDLWRSASERNAISAVRTFQQCFSLQADDGLGPWQFLFLLSMSGDGGAMAQIESEFDDLLRRVPCRPVLWKSEALNTVPSADMPILDQSHAPSPYAMWYKVEYIFVYSGHLPEYNEVMHAYDGDAKARMIEKGFIYDFQAFESADTLRERPEAGDWNILHVMGLPNPENFKDLPREFDIALEAREPGLTHKAVYGRFPEIREKRRHVISRLTPELSALRGAPA